MSPQQDDGMCVRPRPCPTCPYRCDVASGVWARHEYDKLVGYDGEIHEQAAAGAFYPFRCHGSPDCLCAGWAGHRDPADLLAVRIGVADGSLDPSVVDYTTDVALFASGAEAAEHGMRDLDAPGPEAQDAIAKLVRADPGRLDHARRSGAFGPVQHSDVDGGPPAP